VRDQGDPPAAYDRQAVDVRHREVSIEPGHMGSQGRATSQRGRRLGLPGVPEMTPRRPDGPVGPGAG